MCRRSAAGELLSRLSTQRINKLLSSHMFITCALLSCSAHPLDACYVPDLLQLASSKSLDFVRTASLLGVFSVGLSACFRYGAWGGAC